EVGAAAGRTVQADTVTGDGGEVEDVGLVGDAIVHCGICGSDAQARNRRPDAVLPYLDGEGVEPAAVPEDRALLEDDAREGSRAREGVADPVLGRGVRAVPRVVLARRVGRADRRLVAVAD